jgi:hypothetical protein
MFRHGSHYTICIGNVNPSAPPFFEKNAEPRPRTFLSRPYDDEGPETDERKRRQSVPIDLSQHFHVPY